MTKYIYLNILAEGQAEREFAQNTLGMYFEPFGIIVDSRCILTSKRKHKKGGLIRYAHAKNDLLRWISEEKGRHPFFTTMFDLYALPSDFPGFEDALKILDPYQRVAYLEKALLADIGHPRFIPYIQLHEFEALILADPEVLLLEYIGAEKEIQQLKEIVFKHDNNPEKVNTGKNTAPSKRIISLIPAYAGNKASVGSTLAGIAGINTQKNRCRHFAEWVAKIQQLAE
jgi:Domain of unknown function (DUF4276)